MFVFHRLKQGPVGWTSKADSTTNPRGLFGDGIGRLWVGDIIMESHPQRKMTTSGSTRDTNAIGVDVPLFGLLPHELDRSKAFLLAPDESQHR